MESATQRKANVKYKQNNYDYVKIRMSKEQREQFRQMVEVSGKGQNEYLLDLIFGAY